MESWQQTGLELPNVKHHSRLVFSRWLHTKTKTQRCNFAEKRPPSGIFSSGEARSVSLLRALVRLNGLTKYSLFFLNNSTKEQTFVFWLPTQHAGVKMQEKAFVHPPTPTSSCSVCTVQEGYLTEKRLNICSSCTTGNFVPPAPRFKRKLIINTLTWLCWRGCVQYCKFHSSQGVVRTMHMFIHMSFFCTQFGCTLFDNPILGNYLSAKKHYVGFLPKSIFRSLIAASSKNDLF